MAVFNYLDAYDDKRTHPVGWHTGNVCQCDWCEGKFSPVKKLDWTSVFWSISAKGHSPGITLTEADAMCSNMMVQPPSIHTGIAAWIPHHSGAPGTLYGITRQPKCSGESTCSCKLCEALNDQALGKTIYTYQKTGFICTQCGDKNDYAAANQPDGTYICSHHSKGF